MYVQGNLSVLCCNCQLLSCFIGYYFCFMEQFSHPALDDSGLPRSLSTSRADPLMNTQHKRVIMEC